MQYYTKFLPISQNKFCNNMGTARMENVGQDSIVSCSHPPKGRFLEKGESYTVHVCAEEKTSYPIKRRGIENGRLHMGKRRSFGVVSRYVVRFGIKM